MVPFSSHCWKYERIPHPASNIYHENLVKLLEGKFTKVSGPAYNWVLLEFLMLALALSQSPIIHQLLFRFSHPSTGSAVFDLWTSGLIAETACILPEAEVCPVQLFIYQIRAATIKFPVCRTGNQKSLLVFFYSRS